MAPSSSRSSNSKPRVPAETSRTPSRGNPPLPANLPNLNPQPSPYISPYAPITTRPSQAATTIFSPQPTVPARSGTNPLLDETHSVDFQTPSRAISTYSSSSLDSIYSASGSRQYAVLAPAIMSNPQNISQVSFTKKLQNLVLLFPTIVYTGTEWSLVVLSRQV